MKYSDNLHVTITSQLKMTSERHNIDTCSMQCTLEGGQPVKTTFSFLHAALPLLTLQFTGYPQTKQEHQESDDDIAQDCSCLV